MSERPISGSYRPSIMGTHGMVASGHYLATQAGARILARGGNAVDAGVAAGIALGVVHSDQVQCSGVAPMICANSARASSPARSASTQSNRPADQRSAARS